jgi:hypothetical protein
MSDLSPISSDIKKVEHEILVLRRGKRGKHYRPHKLVMLLAVIELAERGLLKDNNIFITEPLLSIFENIFILVKREDDLCQPGPPFFHLRNSDFGIIKYALNMHWSTQNYQLRAGD